MKRGPGRIRVIGGSLRNSRLEVPELPGLRPTPERVRETLFNWLAPVLDGARGLDLCAGTGALGIEALSRGAAQVQFVEADAGAARALEANLARLRVADRGRVAALDARRFLDGPPQPFDLVWLDPPFAAGLWGELAERLERGWLAPAAWLYVESPRDAAPASLPAGWVAHREAVAGEVRHALYRRAQAVPLS